MSVCIIGDGLAAHATAMEMKIANPTLGITMIGKQNSENQTQIAGMRLRTRIANSNDDPYQQLIELFASRNNNVITDQMKHFASISRDKVEFWQKFDNHDPLPFHDSKELFGPQWGNSNAAGLGRGLDVLRWFKRNAVKLGIEYRQAEIQKVFVNNGSVDGLIALNQQTDTEGKYLEIYADQYVFAGGTPGGSMFKSTNKATKFTPQELLFEAGLPIIDSSLIMTHPFGRLKNDKTPTHGCFETDNLQNAVVVFPDGTIDEATTTMLREHKAHYHFPEIVQRFREKGSVIELHFKDDQNRYLLDKTGKPRIELAGLSHHYSHMSIPTSDGVAIAGLDNGFAVGDAAGTGHWFNHKVRFPGTALANCLVGAEMMSQHAAYLPNGQDMQINISHYYEPEEGLTPDELQEMREINTHYLFDIECSSPQDAKRKAQEWRKQLLQFRDTPIVALSEGTAYAMEKTRTGEESEPFPISRELTNTLRRETEKEINHETRYEFHNQRRLI